MYHKPVLLEQSVDALCIEEKKDGVFIDATLGGGGHTREILDRLGSKGTLLVFDQDEDAIENAPDDKRVIAVRSNFRFIENFVKYHKIEGVDGIIADLGVSSHQFDTAERGFSYRFDSQLDMRMNTEQKLSARELIAESSLDDLTRIFREYGELDNARKVATLICRQRESGEPILTTSDLKRVLEKLYNPQTERKFLGKVFQALRIEVNQEMRALEDLLCGAKEVLLSGGRLSVITYHSLEDRIVKNFLRDGKAEGSFSIVNKKPILPTEEEMAANGRSRSAKLRVAERVRQSK
ncbi:MAG: 16S rRNA (cytosine(1402)-N(4))-methyltransferase RsmH [Bacteroidales bacterium]|nr:16S rRNA (cytosine(1402)-N(4))-methyltransferase RsmH [Bacteroidales bacterium]